jgi:hypothetical protein
VDADGVALCESVTFRSTAFNTSTPEKHFVSRRAYSSQFCWRNSQILTEPLPRLRRDSPKRVLRVNRNEPPTTGGSRSGGNRSRNGRRSRSHSMWLCLRSLRHRDWCWPAVVQVLLSMLLVEGATVNSPSHLRFHKATLQPHVLTAWGSPFTRPALSGPLPRCFFRGSWRCQKPFSA